MKLAVFGGASLGKNKGVTWRTEARPRCNTHHGTPGPAPAGASYPLRVETDLKPSLKAPIGNPLGSLAPWLIQCQYMALFQFFKGPFLLLEVTSDLPWFPGGKREQSQQGTVQSAPRVETLWDTAQGKRRSCKKG